MTSAPRGPWPCSLALAIGVISCAQGADSNDLEGSGGAYESARTFYVRAQGDDENTGQQPEQAWRSLERVNRELLAPGDRVWFEAGSTFSGTLRLRVQGGGDARTPVRVSSFGEGRATIAAGAGDGIVVSDLSGVVIERLRVAGDWDTDAQRGNSGEGVRVVATRSGQRREFVRLRELEVSGFKLAGIGLHARPDDNSKHSGYRDVEISASSVHDNGDVGVVSDGPYTDSGSGYSHAEVRVHHVRAFSNRGLAGKTEHTGSGIVLSDVDDALIEHSIAHDNGALNAHGSGGGYGIWAWDARRVVIQYCESYDNHSQTADGGGFDLDGGVTESVMRYNYSHGNHGAGFGAFQFAYARPFHDNQIHSNISQDDGYGLLMWDGQGDMGALAVLHNVVYGAAPAFATFSEFSSVVLVDNIFYGTGPVLADVADARGLTLQGNVYWSPEAKLALRWNTGTSGATRFDDFDVFRARTEQETSDGVATGSFQDPQFSDPGTGQTLDDTAQLQSLTQYQLREDSPLRDRGVDPREFGLEPIDRDFFGGMRPSGDAFDPGIHELH